MSNASDRDIANMEGTEALPRWNGELVFEAPWEGRAFGLAVAMNELGFYPWREFRGNLVEAISTVDKAYYEQWLASLEKLVIAKGFVTFEELEARTAEYASGDRDDDHR